ncbi:MAG: AAA family ATPase [bacterium]|nr:AAA family ATPase [bacterium]
MANIKNAPNQPFVETKGKFDWENEATLVDRRNSFLNQLSRLVRSVWLWVAIIGVITVALFDADFMRTLISIMGLAIQIVLLISIFLIQFVLMFWFLSRTRQYTIMPGAEGVSFKDYRGQPEVLEQARQMVTLLRGVQAFEGAGGEPLNGLLLEGPPGTGKTWLAQAISTEAGVPYYYIDTASLQGMFLGTGAMKVSRLYNKARKAAKEYGAAVIFMDEIDAIGSRGGVSGVGGGTQGQAGGMGLSSDLGLLNTLLVEMSGFNLEHGWRARLRSWWFKKVLRTEMPMPHKRVLTIGATNRIGALDPALLRPGRFDKKLRIDAPDMEGRRDIFEYYLSKMAHDESMDPLVLSTETPGYTPADIKYLLNETLRYALFEGRRYMTYGDFQRALPEHESGLRAPVKHMSREARERLAYHEAGHALAVRLFMPHHRISRITIIRQGSAFGHVSHFPARESYQGLRTRDQFMDRLRVAVAGKAAEIEFCGLQNQTLGVGGDFATIRGLLRSMALAGMFGPLGGSVAPLTITMFGVQGGSPTPEMSRSIEEAYQRILKETREALRERRDLIEALKTLLLQKEELMADEVRAFFDGYGLHTPDPSMIKDGAEVSLLTPKSTAVTE